MQNRQAWALEDIRGLFSEKHIFVILVRFHERMRKGHIARQVRKRVEASSMSEACTKAIAQFSSKSEVRIGGIILPSTLKLGSKRPPYPFLPKKDKTPKHPFSIR